MRTLRIILLTLLATSMLLACAGRKEMRGQEVTGLDRKLATFSYIESGDLVEFIVSTKPTRYREDGPYIPIEIAIGNRGLKQLTLTRESFILLDENGNRYPAANPKELMQNYDFLDWDRNLSELPGIVDARYAAFTRYPSKFSPTRQIRTSRSSLVRDMVSLPKFGYLIDYLYFRLPETGVKGHRFELFMQAPELPDPVFVKFEVK
jgi:hypothetical protein